MNIFAVHEIKRRSDRLDGDQDAFLPEGCIRGQVFETVVLDGQVRFPSPFPFAIPGQRFSKSS